MCGESQKDRPADHNAQHTPNACHVRAEQSQKCGFRLPSIRQHASLESEIRFQRAFPASALLEISVSDRSSEFAALPAAHRDLSDTARQRARIATMAGFFIAGMMYASWGVHVPTVRDRFHLNAALLSVALLAVAGGSIGAMVTNASWIARVGTRRACLTGGLVMAACAA